MHQSGRSQVGRRALPALFTGSAAAVLASAAPPGRVAIRTGYAAGDGVRLHLVQAGEGPLMLFLHGLPDDWTLYDAQLQEFAHDHLAAAPNLRGIPPSDMPETVDAYRMPRLLADVHSVLDHLGRQRCVLVGNDWGGYVAWVFAAAWPDRVERLVILNAPHPLVHLREVRGNPVQIRASWYERDFHAAPAPYPAWYNYYRADPIKVPGSPEAAEPVPDLAAHFFAGLPELPPGGTSLQVVRPTLVIWGMQDPYILPGQLDGLQQHAPDLTLLRIEGAGHRPMRTHPALVNRAIRNFLQRS
jgi:epoxide hydrolase 4